VEATRKEGIQVPVIIKYLLQIALDPLDNIKMDVRETG
jgi:hypothetical protein